MRRTGESLHVTEFHHPPNFPWILAAIPESQDRHTGFTVPSWSLFLLFLGILLAWVSSGFPDLSSTNSDTGTGEMSLLGASSLSRTDISPTVGEEGEDEEDEEEWLSCFIGVRKDDEDVVEELIKPGTTIGTKFSVLQILRIPSLMRCGFLTIDPFVGIPVFIAKLSSDNTAGVFSRTFMVKNISNSLTYTVASSCVCTSPLAIKTIVEQHVFVSIHFSIIQVPFADHVHWRSGVDNKFSFLRFQSWCRQAPIFGRWEEWCFVSFL